MRQPRHVRFLKRLPQQCAGDIIAVGVLLMLTGLVAWNRMAFDAWLLRYDVYTQFLPWYHHLGEHVRAGDVPGWNPHLFSGTPFAGHPLTGWMYLPAMLAFALFPVLIGFKVMVLLQLVLAALSTYALGRVLGMGPIAALVAAVAFTFGPFVEWNTYTSLQFAQFAAWIPLALLGVELAVRAPHWHARLVPWCIAAVATSQMLAGWVGEGWIYTALLIGSWAGYRGLLSQSWPGVGFVARLRLAVLSGTATLVGGAALGAAAVLPRLAVNAQPSLAGGNYSELGDAGILNPPWEASYLATQVLGFGDGYHFRAAGFGAAVVVLMLLAVLFAGARFAVPFFAGLTVVSLVLTLDATPLHDLFYLIPRYEDLHEHDPWRVVALASVGPAMLSGAGVEMVGRLRGSYRLLPLVMLPLVIVTVVAVALDEVQGVAGWAPLTAAAAVTAIAMVVIDLPPDGGLRPSLRWLPRAMLALAVVVVFLVPTGLELTGSWLGWPDDPRWENRWNPESAEMQALDREVRTEVPGGAGRFLEERLAEAGPFRYLGYGGVGHPEGGWTSRSYMDRRFDPFVQAILVNGRPMFLDLYEIQGYDPIQLTRYVAFIAAVNGKGQDYHTAFVSDEGVDSPLLDLLDVQYVLVDATLPPNRPDVQAIAESREIVFRTDFVTVYRRQADLPHAWIVHDVRQIDRGEALPLLVDGAVDPYRTALVEGTVPELESVEAPADDHAEVIRYDPDVIEIATRTDASGFLVVSEIYADGWHASVDGEPVEIVPTHHALRGVPIPAGESVVEMRYEPMSLQVGLWISGGSALLVAVAIGAVAWQCFRRSRSIERP